MAKTVRAKEATYLDQETKRTFKVWHPQVKFEGRWCYLPDQESRTKLQEAEDEVTAIEQAVQAARKIEANKTRVAI
ncbi:hypothetical protein B1748_23580 [Paenibacillus sp. MY03]|uniref:hypothetical protein n=1 Tax=Paenibacillus sp. MY03 TaxID=302980 RepID=UPI000B3CBDB7|nr:hypothetical protein [Paenibacillus sp. MY03]OUS72993.1 hypothetical protein B1748_23580 [Paenibacillus sp. MY03]